MKARQVATQVYILYKEFVDISYENASFGIQASWSILYKKFVDI